MTDYQSLLKVNFVQSFVKRHLEVTNESSYYKRYFRELDNLFYFEDKNGNFKKITKDTINDRILEGILESCQFYIDNENDPCAIFFDRPPIPRMINMVFLQMLYIQKPVIMK